MNLRHLKRIRSPSFPLHDQQDLAPAAFYDRWQVRETVFQFLIRLRNGIGLALERKVPASAGIPTYRQARVHHQHLGQREFPPQQGAERQHHLYALRAEDRLLPNRIAHDDIKQLRPWARDEADMQVSGFESGLARQQLRKRPSHRREIQQGLNRRAKKNEASKNEKPAGDAEGRTAVALHMT